MDDITGVMSTARFWGDGAPGSKVPERPWTEWRGSVSAPANGAASVLKHGQTGRPRCGAPQKSSRLSPR
jgi:hypothetical protein